MLKLSAWVCTGGVCYFFPGGQSRRKKRAIGQCTHDEAEEECERIGGHLLALETIEEASYVMDTIFVYGKKYNLQYSAFWCFEEDFCLDQNIKYTMRGLNISLVPCTKQFDLCYAHQ